MRNRKWVLFSSLILAITFLPVTAHSEESSHEVSSTDTQVGIRIVEPPLWLVEVNNLDFGQKHVGETSATAKNDLVIKLKDNRFDPESVWRLSLKMSPFISDSGHSLGNTSVSFDPGEAEKGSQPEPDIKGEENFKVVPNEMKIIAKQMTPTGQGEYVYRVSKDKIQMTLPTVTEPGKYKASMDWVITDAP